MVTYECLIVRYCEAVLILYHSPSLSSTVKIWAMVYK
jgi:hypothetical protein